MIEITGAERDVLILDILKRLEESKPHADAGKWELGWRAALDKFRANPCEESLVPDFIRDLPVRHRGGFYRGLSELDYVRKMQEWLSQQFIDCATVYEFGCGTGFNLVALSHLLPADFCGFDRSKCAVQVVREASAKLDLPIGADCFDMLKPSPYLIPPNTGVFTFGAMEQLGDFKPFLNYLIEAKPKVVCHIEPISELLDPNNLVDWLSLKFHEKRGYTVGMVPYLNTHPGVEVVSVERSYFGSLMLESYARVVWRPR